MDGHLHTQSTEVRDDLRRRREQLALEMAAADTTAPRGTPEWERYCQAVEALARFDELHPDVWRRCLAS